MKFSYSMDEIEAWRDRKHRRLPHMAVVTPRQALTFINDVGFCFAFKSENSELPCLWHSACGTRNPSVPHQSACDPSMSFVQMMRIFLPYENKVYAGNVLRRRPTLVSLEYLPYFYVLSNRTGVQDDYIREFGKGELSLVAKLIMDTLADTWPLMTKDLRAAMHVRALNDWQSQFVKAMTELQRKMYIVRISEEGVSTSSAWATVDKSFPRQIEKARKISLELAQRRILEKYFRNQLVTSAESVQRLFRWDKQSIYKHLGHLVQHGIITPNIRVEARNNHYYCLIN